MISSNNPEFSIVIPVRNGDPYLREALDSIFKQSYQRFKILILENCSQDDTLSIIYSYQDPRITIVPAPTDLSIEENWARILDLELLEYMTVMGHDDVLYPDFLKEMVRLITAAPDASLYQSHFHLIDENGKIIRDCKPMPYRDTAEGFLKSRQTLQRDSYGTGYVMRSADYKQIGGLPAFPKLICADDVAWYKLACLSHIVCSSEYLFRYRYHHSSTSYTVDLYMLYSAYKQYWEFLSQSDYFISTANADAAYRYITAEFNSKYHRDLVYRALDPDDNWKSQYAVTKKHLLLEAKQDALFPVYDTTSALLEVLLNLRPILLRRAIAKALIMVADVSRWIKTKVLR